MGGSRNRKGTGIVNDSGPFSSSHWDGNNPAVRVPSPLVGFLLGFLLQAWPLISLILSPLHSRLSFWLLVLVFIVCHGSEALDLVERNHGLRLE